MGGWLFNTTTNYLTLPSLLVPVASSSASSPRLLALWSPLGSRYVAVRFSACPSPMRSSRPAWTRSFCPPPFFSVFLEKGWPLLRYRSLSFYWYISPVRASLDVRCPSAKRSAHPAATCELVRALLEGLRPGSASLCWVWTYRSTSLCLGSTSSWRSMSLTSSSWEVSPTVSSPAGGGSSRQSGLDVSWRSRLLSSSWEVFPMVSSAAGGGSSRRSVSGGPLDVLVLSGSSRRFDSGNLLVFVVFFCFDAPFCVERGLARSRFSLSRSRDVVLFFL